MQPMPYEQSVISICQRDSRFDPQAYIFLKEALDFTVTRAFNAESQHTRHVTGKELLEGFRDYALSQFGPMAWTVMKEWGITQGSDVGDMVFLLIEEQVFGKQDSDRREDFEGVLNLAEQLQAPFLPKSKLSPELVL